MDESVAIIIFNKNKDQVLLIKRRDIPVWVLPGGGIEAGETPEQAALREAKEETGLTVALTRKVALYSPVNRLTRPTHFYEAEALQGALRTGDETQEIAFFPLDRLPQRLAPPYPLWIKDAALFSPSTLHKKIEGTSYCGLLKHLLFHPLITLRFLLTKIGIHFNAKE